MFSVRAKINTNTALFLLSYRNVIFYFSKFRSTVCSCDDCLIYIYLFFMIVYLFIFLFITLFLVLAFVFSTFLSSFSSLDEIIDNCDKRSTSLKVRQPRYMHYHTDTIIFCPNIFLKQTLCVLAHTISRKRQ